MTARASTSTAAPTALQQALAEEVERIKALLQAHQTGATPETESVLPEASAPSDGGPLDGLVEVFGLTDFERDLLMLCAAVELDATAADAVSHILVTPDPRPTLGLALACLPKAHWDALVPEAPLRSWQLITVSGGDTLVGQRATIDERILQHILGLPGLDRRLNGVVTSMAPDAKLYPSHRQLSTNLAEWLTTNNQPTLVTLGGGDESARRSVAAAALHDAGASAMLVIAAGLPGPGPALHDTARLIDREWILSRRLPVLTGIDANSHVVAALLEMISTPVVITSGTTSDALDAAASRSRRHEELSAPTPTEQRELWHTVIDGTYNDEMASAIEDVSHRHRLSANTITAIGRELNDTTSQADVTSSLISLSRERSRSRLDTLAQRVTSQAGWDDIVLPQGHLALLRDIARHVKHRTTVYERWGFGDLTSRGLGVTALFAGESGTGKTLAAEIIANELELDLYRVDLAATVSKYIGETEKNLARLFDAAERSGAVLLFDEADALFGKRTEVRDSHDRYANLEVAYLLQRMETYRGLAILTTNLRSNLDRAFVRRVRFIVQFPFPNETQRAEIWRRTFPPQTPLENVDPHVLAKLTIPGGSIWSIALAAAFSAAEAQTPVTTELVLHAARTEYAKTDRALTSVESGGLE